MQHNMEKLRTLKQDLAKGTLIDEDAFSKKFLPLVKCPLGSNDLSLEVLDRVSSWQEFTKFHLELVKEVLAILHRQHSRYNQLLAEKNISSRLFLREAQDGLSGGRVYPLKNKGIVDLVGDLHSDPVSLLKIIKQSGFLDNQLKERLHRLVFLGDYVDRGRSHLGMTTALLSLKYLFEDSVFLLRGNHDGGILLEDGSIKLPYRKPDQEEDTDYFPLYLKALGEKVVQAKPLLPAYLELWDNLAHMAVIERGERVILAVHGGIARPLLEEGGYFSYLKNLAYMTSETLTDPTGRTMAQNMMWSDPYRGSGDLREGLGRFYYTEEQLKLFLKTIEADCMVRGHEAFGEGIRAHFEGLVHTVFSSGGLNNPMTAYPSVNPHYMRIEAKGTLRAYPIL